MNNFGKRIRLARVAKDLSQEQLAVKINRTRPLISYIETTGKVNSHTLKSICKVLDLSIHDMENELNDPEAYYQNNSTSALKKENARLNEEITILKELIATQKEIISELRNKNTNRRK